jgi:hypothetical protein
MVSDLKGKTLASAAPIPRISNPEPASRGGVLPDVGNEKAAAPQTDRKSQISLAAYYKAEQRGFTSGNEIADWLAAEQEVDAHEANRSGTPVEAQY